MGISFIVPHGEGHVKPRREKLKIPRRLWKTPGEAEEVD